MTTTTEVHQIYDDGHRVVTRNGEPGRAGEHAHYGIMSYPAPDPSVARSYVDIPFQPDTIPNVGVVGATNECLLAIVIDRLKAFQAGEFACWQNRRALNDCRASLVLLEGRTAEREKRGVEGQHVA